MHSIVSHDYSIWKLDLGSDADDDDDEYDNGNADYDGKSLTWVPSVNLVTLVKPLKSCRLFSYVQMSPTTKSWTKS